MVKAIEYIWLQLKFWYGCIFKFPGHGRGHYVSTRKHFAFFPVIIGWEYRHLQWVEYEVRGMWSTPEIDEWSEFYWEKIQFTNLDTLA